MFTEREPGQPIVYVRSHSPGNILDDSINDGNSVELRIENERVLVRDIESTSNNNYKGIIYGFEPSFLTEFKGLKLDEVITFGERHIFCYVKK
ncbi:MAG: hypothetical protein AB2652_09010 [Candidatus Thiodiazotropha endolucinida]